MQFTRYTSGQDRQEVVVRFVGVVPASLNVSSDLVGLDWGNVD